MNIFYRKWRSFLFRVRYANEILKDRMRGVDFTSPVSKEKAGTQNFDDALYYASSGYVPEVRMALEYLNITSQDSIIDYGCGKGAVLVTFAKYPFRKIAGIDLSRTLLETCELNLIKLNLQRIELITGDATTFTDIDDFNFFYFFNPFSGQVFDTVISNIIRSAENSPRKVTLIYYHPKCHENIVKTGKFSLTKSFVDGARRLNIYQTL